VEKKIDLKADIKKIVSKIEIKKRGTLEGEAQREAFRIRWGKRPEQI
jgi:hypothetical protein